VPTIVPKDGIVSAGYDGLDDIVSVTGVDAAALVAALDAQAPGMGNRAREAIDAGTVCADGSSVSVTR